MKISINKQNEIIAYSTIGDIPNSIDIQVTIPDNFEDDFKPSYFLYQDNEIVINPNYQEPVIDIPEPQPSESDKQVAQLTYQQMMTTQDVATLQAQNAQMAYQLMTTQGGATA